MLSNANNNAIHGIFIDDDCNNNEITAIGNCNNNANYGVYFDNNSNNLIGSISTTGNSSGAICEDIGTQYIRNALLAEATEVMGFTNYVNARIYSWQHDQTADNHWMFTDNGTISTETGADRHTASGVAWKYTPLALRNANYVLDEVIAEVAVAAGTQVTITCFVKKSHATNIGASLIIRGGQLAGVAADVTDTKADDLIYEQLTVQCTPTEAGVLKVTGAAWYISGNANAFFDDLTVAQV